MAGWHWIGLCKQPASCLPAATAEDAEERVRRKTGEVPRPKILWLSRHRPVLRQIAALRERYGADVQIDQSAQVFATAESDAASDILRQVADGGYDEVVIVAPMSLIAELCNRGLRPLRAEMQARSDMPARFDRFVRIVRCELVTEELA